MISALFLSFLWPGVYRDVGKRWRGIGFFYLVLLGIIAWVPTGIYAQRGYRKFLTDEAPKLLKDTPNVSIKNGVVTADPDPFLWRDPKSRQVIAYIDTTGSFDDPAGKDAAMKLSKNSLEYKQNFETRKVDLSQVKSFHMDREEARKFFEKIGGWVGIVVGLLGIFAVLWHLIGILIFGAIGMALSSAFNANLTYAGAMRVAAVALTPAIVLATILTLAGVSFPGEWLMYLALELLFLFIGVKANSMPPTYGGPGAYPYAAGQYPQQGYAAPGYPAQPAGYPAQPPGYPAQTQGYSPAPGYPQQPPPPPPGYPR